MTATNGTLGLTKLTTVKGRNSTDITSDLVGTAMITATSPGLNPGSTYLTITQVPIVLNFSQWIHGNPLEGKTLNKQFNTSQELTYNFYFIGNATNILGWPNARIEINGTLIGEETIDSDSLITKTYSQYTLPAGNHILSVTMTNHYFFRNLYVDNVTLSE